VRRWLVELRRLTPAERRALLRAWALLLLAPLLLRLRPLPRLLSSIRSERGAPLDPERVAWLVGAAARYAPGARCLPVALVTAWMLARQGTSATLRVGVARHAGHLTAHAWLEHDGHPLLAASGADAYAPILAVVVTAQSESAPR
jgi:Transglutaminase-like superfamily